MLRNEWECNRTLGEAYTSWCGSLMWFSLCFSFRVRCVTTELAPVYSCDVGAMFLLSPQVGPMGPCLNCCFLVLRDCSTQIWLLLLESLQREPGIGVGSLSRQTVGRLCLTGFSGNAKSAWHCRVH
ncbi:unnamed protein product [Ectocarpus sp. 12 AP-2014]